MIDYIKEDGTAVVLDDGLYVKFITNHFSIYAVYDEDIKKMKILLQVII